MTSTPLEEIIIRHTTPEDLPAFRELRLKALKDHPTAYGSDYEEALLKPLSYWGGRLAVIEKEQAMFLAEHNGQLIGMTGIFRNMTKKNHHSASIISVYIRPEWRGKHIAEALIRTCLDWAIKHEVVIVKLAVVTSNASAIRSYERCGFKLYGTDPKALYIDGVYYDEHLMALEILHPKKE